MRPPERVTASIYAGRSRIYRRKMEGRKMDLSFCPPFFCITTGPMPISIPIPLRRLSQQEFGDIAYETMHHVFDIHHELGRFFDERIYKNELARRLPGVRLEVPIDLSFGSFGKR